MLTVNNLCKTLKKHHTLLIFSELQELFKKLPKHCSKQRVKYADQIRGFFLTQHPTTILPLSIKKIGKTYHHFSTAYYCSICSSRATTTQ